MFMQPHRTSKLVPMKESPWRLLHGYLLPKATLKLSILAYLAGKGCVERGKAEAEASYGAGLTSGHALLMWLWALVKNWLYMVVPSSANECH